MKQINLLLIVAISLSINACKKDKEVVVVIPDVIIQYSCIDSMKLDSQYLRFTYDTILFNKVNKKQYIANSDKAVMKFANEANNKFSIQLTDQANTAREVRLYISFDNRTVNNISGTYSLSAPGVCVEWVQFLEYSTTGSFFTRTTPLTCEQIRDGIITIQYDVVTNTISGKIERLKYTFSSYAPLYVNGYRPPLSLSGFLSTGGSSRNQEITFKYVKQR